MDPMVDVVEYIDPDWREHFTDAEDAAEHYQQFAKHEWEVAYREITGERWFEDF